MRMADLMNRCYRIAGLDKYDPMVGICAACSHGWHGDEQCEYTYESEHVELQCSCTESMTREECEIRQMFHEVLET